MGSKSDFKKVLPIVLAASGVLAGAAESEVKLWSRTFQAEKCKSLSKKRTSLFDN